MSKYQPYSVLLLYPTSDNNSGTETYYAHVQAESPVWAVLAAQAKASEGNDGAIGPKEFEPLLVIAGHQPDLS